MNLNAATLDITCPHCGQKGSETFAGIQDHGYTCPGCGLVIEPNSDQIASTIKAAEKALRDFAAGVTRTIKI